MKPTPRDRTFSRLNASGPRHHRIGPDPEAAPSTRQAVLREQHKRALLDIPSIYRLFRNDVAQGRWHVAHLRVHPVLLPEGSAAYLHYSAEQLVQSFLAPKGAGDSATPRNVKAEVPSTVAQIAVNIASSEGCVCFFAP